MPGGASVRARKRVLLSQFLDTDHQINVQPMGREAYDMGHIATLNISAICPRRQRVPLMRFWAKSTAQSWDRPSGAEWSAQRNRLETEFCCRHIAQSSPWGCKRRARIAACKLFTAKRHCSDSHPDWVKCPSTWGGSRKRYFSALCKSRLTRSPFISTNPRLISCCPVQSYRS